MTATAAIDDEKIVCKIDGARVHSIAKYIKERYASEWTVERYQTEFPGEPLLSDKAIRIIQDARAKQGAAAPSAASGVILKPMSEVFNIPPAKTVNPRGEQIMVEIWDSATLTEEDRAYIPDIDPNYVFNIEMLKDVLVAVKANRTVYAWGLHGTGKTTLFEQVCARLNRPFMRLQHTVNTEEAHIVGQWTVKNGETVFNLGPLPMAMIKGYAFCADEYDGALPSVSLVYQAVLERKPLMIKEAPPELRIIRPHPNFRFFGTGNTNGSGDETGLYQGTQIQNAANYSRWNLTIEVDYPEPNVEKAIIAGQAGIKLTEAAKFVEFATEVRKMFRAGQLSMTVSPRELINAGELGRFRGANWRKGLELAFMNRLNRTDRQVCNQFAQRLFG